MTIVTRRESILLLIAVGGGLAVTVAIWRDWLFLMTGLVFIVACWAGAAFVMEIALRVFSVKPRRATGLRISLATFGVLLIAIELLLRLIGTHTSYLERNEGGPYPPLYRDSAPSWFHTLTPDIDYCYERPEFEFPRTTNSLGLSEREIPTEKAPDEFRIIALGDSFTEGVGTSYDKTWIKTAEADLKGAYPDRNIQAFNAGISGSDPLFEYVLLKEKLLAYKPDLVIVATNTSDVDDVILRGGMDRFQPDGSVRFTHEGPSWEWLYGISYTFRHVVHGMLRCNHLLIPRDDVPRLEDGTVKKLEGALRAFAELSKAENFRLMIALHPNGGEVESGEYRSGFATLGDAVRQDPNILLCDVLDTWMRDGPLTRENFKDFYWPMDGHHNPRGYEAMGHVIGGAIRKSGLLVPK